MICGATEAGAAAGMREIDQSTCPPGTRAAAAVDLKPEESNRNF